jgi:hypothetical protein
VTCKSGTIVAAGVVAVPKEQQQRKSWAGLTDFVIVQVFRSTGEPCTRTLADGRTETLPTRRRPGELSWQLDTGEFRDDPVIGPLWYQARGWSCQMDGSGDLDEICGLVRPRGRPAAFAAHPGVAPLTASSSPNTADKVVSPTIGRQQLISGDMPRLPPLVLTPGHRYIELVSICVTDTGSVAKITTLTSSNSLLAEVVRDTVKDWKYKPLEIDGHPVAFCYAGRFEFAP